MRYSYIQYLGFKPYIEIRCHISKNFIIGSTRNDAQSLAMYNNLWTLFHENALKNFIKKKKIHKHFVNIT